MIKTILKVIGWAFIFIFCLIGIMASIGQIPPGQDSYNDGFAQYPVVTLLHVIPGILFLILGPMQFMPFIRNRFLRLHRWSGRIFLLSSSILGLAGLLIAVVFPFAGVPEQLAIFFFSTIFLLSIFKAYKTIRRFEIEKHREWVIRIFSIGIGIGLIRVFIGVLVGGFGFPQIDIFAYAFWGGFGLCWITGEFWIRITRDSRFSQ